MAVSSPINWFRQIRNRNPVLALRMRGTGPEDFAALGVTPTLVGSATSTDGPEWLPETDRTAIRLSNASGASASNYYTLGTSLNTFLLAAHNTAWCARFCFRIPTTSVGLTQYSFGNVNFGFILGAMADYSGDTNAVCFRMANNAGTFKRCITAAFPNYKSGQWYEIEANYDPNGVNPHNSAVTGSVLLSVNGVAIDSGGATPSVYAANNTTNNTGSASALTSTSLAVGAAFNAATPQTYSNNSVLDIAYLTITRGRGGIRERKSDARTMFFLSQGHDGRPVENGAAAYGFVKAMSSQAVGFGVLGDSTTVGDIDTETISSTVYEAYKIGHLGGLTRALADRFGIAGTGVYSALFAGSLSGAYLGVAAGGFGSGSAAWSAMPDGLKALVASGQWSAFTGAAWDNTAKTLTVPTTLTAVYTPRVGDWVFASSGLSALPYAVITAISGANNEVWTCTKVDGTAINIANTAVAGAVFNADAVVAPTPFFVADGSTQSSATVSNCLFVPKNLYFDFSGACRMRAVFIGSTAGSASGVMRLRLNDGSSDLVSADVVTKSAAPDGASTSGTEWLHRQTYTIAAGTRIDGNHRVSVNGGAGAVGPGGLAYWQIYKANPIGAVVSVLYSGGGLSTRTVLGTLLGMSLTGLAEWMKEATAACEQSRRLVIWYTSGENDDQVAQSIPPAGYAGAATRSAYYEGEYQNTRSMIERLEAAWALIPGTLPNNLLVVKAYHPSSAYLSRRGTKHAAWRRVMNERLNIGSKAQVVIIHPDLLAGFQQLITDGYIPSADPAHPFYDTYNELYPQMIAALVDAAQAGVQTDLRKGGFIQRV